MEVRPLSGAVAAEVTDVDLAGTLAPGLFDELRDAFRRYCVLIFPGRPLAPEAHRRFARLWGEPTVVPYLAAHAVPDYPEILRVTNLGKAKTLTERWHSDSPFLACPPSITILAAQQLPPTGGDTMWANQYLAYDTLSSAMRRLLDGLRLEFRGSQPGPTGEREPVSAFHPLVRTHPETGRKALYLGHPGDSVGIIEGMTEDESRALLEFLFEAATRPDLAYRHRWRDGDLVMWDNRCTLHYAVHDYGESPRTLHRITVEGDEPR